MEIRKLNTLRALAAMIVLVTHFSDATNWLGGNLGGRAGQYGVMIFFMLSGFLLSYLYMDKQWNNAHIKKYAFSRIGRVVPLFLLVVFLSYLFKLKGIEGLFEISDTKELLSHVLFMSGESVLWTVSAEMQFYALFILLWGVVSWRPGYLYVLIVAIFVLLFFTNFPRPHGQVFAIPYDIYLFRSIPYFMMGVLFGKHYKTLVIPDYLKSSWFILMLLLIPFMYPEFTPVTKAAKMRMWLDFGVLIVVSSVFFSVVFLVPNKAILLSNKIGDFIGKVSYSLYLLHMPVLWQINKLTINLEFKFLLFLSCSLIMATISYKYFELPVLKFIKNLAAKKSIKEK